MGVDNHWVGVVFPWTGLVRNQSCPGRVRLCSRVCVDVVGSFAIGYPTYKIQSLLTIRDKTIHRRDPGEDDRKTLVLPYIPGLSENTFISCRGLPVRVPFSSRFTFRSSLTKLKDPIPPWDKTGVIYSILCCCGRSYIGETGRSFKKHTFPNTKEQWELVTHRMRSLSMLIPTRGTTSRGKRVLF